MVSDFMEYTIIDAPCAGDEIVLKTYIYDMQESLAKKYIAMYDKCGKCLAKADTVWVYMNIDTQAPALPDRNDMGWRRRTLAIDQRMMCRTKE